MRAFLLGNKSRSRVKNLEARGKLARAALGHAKLDGDPFTERGVEGVDESLAFAHRLDNKLEAFGGVAARVLRVLEAIAKPAPQPALRIDGEKRGTRGFGG